METPRLCFSVILLNTSDFFSMGSCGVNTDVLKSLRIKSFRIIFFPGFVYSEIMI